MSKMPLRPGFISGVAARVMKTWGVGVDDGGNQAKVGEGSGVSVGMTGVGVARSVSSAVQDVMSNIIARSHAVATKQSPNNDGIASVALRPRNDMDDMNNMIK